jgi:murein DD-endopeptidase MepM/ murein hydrolase activator NlpD
MAVSQGQVIGKMGNSGVFETSDGVHLHFEMQKDGEYVNPEIYLK